MRTFVVIVALRDMSFVSKMLVTLSLTSSEAHAAEIDLFVTLQYTFVAGLFIRR